MNNPIIPFIVLYLFLIFVFNTFKNEMIHNITIGLYCLFILYGYLHIHKKYALVGFVALLVSYALLRSKSKQLVENMENKYIAKSTYNKQTKKNIKSNRKSIEPFDEGVNGTKDEEDDDSKDEDEDKDTGSKDDNEDDDDEKGIEQFGLSDKFSELHGMIHKMQNAAKQQHEKQQREKQTKK